MSKSSFTFAALLAALIVCVVAPGPAIAAAPAEDYATVAAGRASKIVDSLALPDVEQASRVSAIVAGQYVRLHAIHESRDARLEEIKAAGATDAAAEKKLVADEATARLYELHAEFLARLAVELAPAQVDQVKDGMTYGVLPTTWRVYQEMLPNLTAEQRRQILAWLIEAREHAIDAGSAEEKHGWFGKYKGRINNYLSAAGYDMKQAEKEMMERQKR